jgi:hypothetical protein
LQLGLEAKCPPAQRWGGNPLKSRSPFHLDRFQQNSPILTLRLSEEVDW